MTPPIVIRPLEASDRRALQYAFRHLGERSRYQRFMSVMPALSERQVERLMAVDHWHHEALIAWATSPRRPLGVARYVRTGEFDVAEVAVEVTDEWQRRGIGTALVVQLARAARSAGVRRLSATMLADNPGAVRLAQAAGQARLHRVEAGVLEVVVTLQRGSGASGPY